MSNELTGECLRRFERVDAELEKKEKRLRDLEKFQVAIISIVGVANFIWIYFAYPLLRAHGAVK